MDESPCGGWGPGCGGWSAGNERGPQDQTSSEAVEWSVGSHTRNRSTPHTKHDQQWSTPTRLQTEVGPTAPSGNAGLDPSTSPQGVTAPSPGPVAASPVPEACDGIPTGIGLWFAEQSVDPNAALRSSTTTVVEANGCFPAGTILEWTASSGDFSNDGRRVNWIPDLAEQVTIEVCATSEQGVTQCLVDLVDVLPSHPRAKIDSVETVLDIGYGKFVEVTGHIEDATAAEVQLALFKHTDLHYIDNTPIQIHADGTFSVTPFLLSNVDRLNLMAIDPTQSVDQLNACTVWWCWGAHDPVSGRNVPVLPDGTDVFDVDVHYLKMSAHVSPAIAALEDRRSPIPVLGTNNAYLYASDAESSLYYAYDQGVVALGLVAAGETALAATILDGMVASQLGDGSWPFLMLQNGNPYWNEGDIRHAGSISWVLMAFNAYHIATGTNTYSAVVEAGLDYLDGQRHLDQGHLPVRFNPSDLATTPWDERSVTSFEHNADAMSAFLGHAQVLGYESHPGVAADLRAWMEARWNGAYFDPGSHTDYGINHHERYLDTQTWGLLALGGTDPTYHAGLANDCSVFLEVAGYLDDMTALLGFSDFAWSSGELPHGAFVWSEGTLGYISALDEVERATGVTLLCEGMDADGLLGTMEQMLTSSQMSTTSSNAHPGYNEVPGTAAMGWWLIIDGGVNPFRPWETL